MFSERVDGHNSVQTCVGIREENEKIEKKKNCVFEEYGIL